MEEASKEKGPVRIGITCGDPNGIGPELIIKCFKDQQVLEGIDPILYGSPELFAYYQEKLGLSGLDIEEIEGAEASLPERVDLCRSWEGAFTPQPGLADKASGEFAFKALEKASSDIGEGKLDALLTAPLNKHSVQSNGRDFPGHTEFLTGFLNVQDSLMFMLSEGLRVGLLTGHLPVKDVPSSIDEGKLLRKLQIMESSLIRDLGFEKPCIAVLGLNPHAGESGMLGSEEGDLISPTIEKAREQQNIQCFGPFPADGLFGSGELEKYDAVLAMYHDQGLTPFKALSFGRGVNFTAGLPIIRTSPDHGTGYGIAGTGKASPDSFRNALFMARDLYRNRQMHKLNKADPLRTQEGFPKMKRTGPQDRS